MDKDPVVITAARRTPLGGFQGDLQSFAATDLGAAAIAAVLADSGIDPADVDEAIMGCVLPAGLGQAPARQAALAAGLPYATGCTTINKVCGSAMKATMLANDLLLAGSNRIMVAGGMESMSNAPYLLPKARKGLRMGHQQVLDHMFFDGLEDAYDQGKLMGCYAEATADHYGFTREDQDNFSIESVKRAQQAIHDGAFTDEIVSVTQKTRKGETIIDTDEQPLKARIDNIPALRPAFRKDGTVTAANSSSISDGGAALLLMRQSEAVRRNITPLARILGHSTHSQEPAWFTTAPVGAIHKLLANLDWTTDTVDLYEINEAFAVVTMAGMHDLKLPHDKVNVHGGACALGHPLGCSGARIIVTLIHALRRFKKQRGVAALCIGGGEATAIGVELF
ncbi:MAG TPA: acetyl-CoA C-acyltransferase [Gammaproteobacteria bacterium]|nr:acetyl-CoA C-acyltransferase [Gammaproteobacteria bacterium]